MEKCDARDSCQAESLTYGVSRTVAVALFLELFTEEGEIAAGAGDFVCAAVALGFGGDSAEAVVGGPLELVHGGPHRAADGNDSGKLAAHAGGGRPLAARAPSGPGRYKHIAPVAKAA